MVDGGVGGVNFHACSELRLSGDLRLSRIAFRGKSHTQQRRPGWISERSIVPYSLLRSDSTLDASSV